MITKDQWYKHGSFQGELREILEMPAMRAALEICRDQELVPIARPAPGIDLLHYFALMGSKKEGYSEFFSNLTSLSRPKAPDLPVTKSWEYDPSAKEKK